MAGWVALSEPPAPLTVLTVCVCPCVCVCVLVCVCVCVYVSLCLHTMLQFVCKHVGQLNTVISTAIKHSSNDEVLPLAYLQSSNSI